MMKSLYACCCTQKVTVKGKDVIDTVSWLSQPIDIFTKFNEVNLQLHGIDLIKAKSAIFAFLSKFNGVQMKSSPSWTLRFQIINS